MKIRKNVDSNVVFQFKSLEALWSQYDFSYKPYKGSHTARHDGGRHHSNWRL